MAKIIKNSNQLEKEYQQEQSRNSAYAVITALLIVAAVLCCAFYVATGMVIFFACGAFAGLGSMLFLFIYCLRPTNNAEILKSGIEGENSTERLLKILPDEYTVVRNATVKYNGGTSEIDSIVVGKTGVFVIETKNAKGYITGSFDDKHWIQHKIGRGSTPYQKELYSPVKQIGTHIYRLAHYLRQNGVRIYVNGAVYFSNREAELDISGRSDIPVFETEERYELLDYIESREETLTENQIKQIVRLIEKCK